MKNQNLKVRLTNADVKLAVLGPLTLQEHPNEDLSQTAKHCIRLGEPLLSYAGAKMYPCGGGWWELRGYGYEVTTTWRNRFTLLRADERETLRMIGYALYTHTG